MKFRVRALCYFLLVICPEAYCHQLHESYLFIDFNDPSAPHLRWEVESDNLESLFHLDSNHNEIISWRELKESEQIIVSYLKTYLHLRMDGHPIALAFESFTLKRKDDQTYLVLTQTLDKNSTSQSINVDYDLFFDIDVKQVCYLTIQQVKAPIVQILKPERRHANILLENFSIADPMFHFFIEGIWHIWLGWDHVLFLLMLLVSSLTSYTFPVKTRFIIKEIVKLVTCFSVAHSLTLILSALDMIALPAKFTETCIALSVLITALVNLQQRQRSVLWQMAIVFGLIHGFGFANSLQEMAVESRYLVYYLLSFNLGVEVGQLALLILITPVLIVLKEYSIYYYRITANITSSLAALIAIIWVTERI